MEPKSHPKGGTPGKEKGLQVIDLQAFWVLVALQVSDTETPSPCGKRHINQRPWARRQGCHELVARETVSAQEQPAAQLLVQRVVPIAGGGLCHLSDKCLGVPAKEVEYRSPAELFFQNTRAEPKADPGTVHNGPAGRRLSAHE